MSRLKSIPGLVHSLGVVVVPLANPLGRCVDALRGLLRGRYVIVAWLLRGRVAVAWALRDRRGCFVDCMDSGSFDGTTPLDSFYPLFVWVICFCIVVVCSDLLLS